MNPRPHQRRTRSLVHASDAIAGGVITLGGIGVIVAVLGICVYLAWTVVPLFRSGSLEEPVAGRVQASVTPGQQIPTTVLAQIDEYQQLLVTLDEAGLFRVLHAPSGEIVAERKVFKDGVKASAFSWISYDGLLGVGYVDGSVQIGTMVFDTVQRRGDELPAAARSIEVGTSRVLELAEGARAVVQRLGPEQFRVLSGDLKLRDVPSDGGSATVHALDYRRTGDRELLVVLRGDGSMVLDQITTITPLGGGEPRVRAETTPVKFAPLDGQGLPADVFVTGDGAHILALWADGTAQRYGADRAGDDGIPLIERVSLLPPGRRVQSSLMMIGGLTLLMGDETGELHAAFAARRPELGIADGLHLVTAHRIRVASEPLLALGVSHRNRSVIAATGSGAISIWNVTAHKQVASGAVPGPVTSPLVALAPKFDAAMLFGGSSLDYTIWPMDPGYVEASFSSLFGKVHYEGDGEATYTYQSSAAGDSAEPKLSLMPLIHGTLKATVFAMLVAVPLAVLAAIYTSEFMSPRTRATVKPAIEMMASLPSVVLGFVAAIIVAPAIDRVVPAVLLGLIVVPIVVLVGAHVWQIVPPSRALRWPAWTRTIAIAGALIVGIALAGAAGPVAERVLFKPSHPDTLVAAGSYERVPQDRWPEWVGARALMSPDEERLLRPQGLYFRNGAVVRPVEPDPSQRDAIDAKIRDQSLDAPSLRRWLDGNIGGPWPGWLLLCVAPAAVIAVLVLRRIWPASSSRTGVTHNTAAARAIGRLGVSLVVTLGLAAGLAALLTAVGLDPRDMVFGPYNQRNTLVVGLIMGFAVIPIIYTISEDAMMSVPASLRSASLGAGATRWQTAVRIVLPVAASGIFSAVMIGLGRAVGETMIVVMATGNTPSMDWNIFSGFRTLSANVAVELPEASQGSTHYRVLFLCGLVLFVMTFAINTSAELIRQYFRRRNAAL